MMGRPAMRPPGARGKIGAVGMKAAGQLSGPVKPRFLQELVVVSLEDAIVIDGTDQLQVLQGKATRNLVPDLIRLMDGNRTQKQLEESLVHVPAEYVRGAMSLMVKCGLVEDAADAPALHSPDRASLAFFRRYLAATHANRSGQAAYEKLQAAEVVIITSAEQSKETLKSLLQKIGVGRVSCFDWASLGQSQWTPAAADRTIVVSLVLDHEDPDAHTRLDEWCNRHKVRWLRAVVDAGGKYADIGPLFQRRQLPCYQCFHAVHSHRAEAPRMPRGPSPADTSFWSSIVATELIYLINGIGPALTGRDFRRYDLETWKSEYLRWFRIPGCPQCFPVHQPEGTKALAGPDSSVPTPLVFEECVGLPSKTFAPSKGSPEQARMIAMLTRQTKRVPHSPKLLLNRDMPKLERGILDLLRMSVADEKAPFTVEELGAVLMMTAGIRIFGGENTQVKRWAATAGNLGSVELFVAVRDVTDVPPGLYFYQAQEHSLAAFQWHNGNLGVDELMWRVAPVFGSSLPQAMIFLTAAFHRVSQKYGTFAYRLVNLDAGAALSQLHLVTRAFKLVPVTLVSWPDDLIQDQLKLEEFEEQATAVVALSQAAITPQLSSEATGAHPSSSKPAHAFAGISVENVTRMLFSESRLKEASLKDAAPQQVFDVPESPHDESSTIALRRPANGGRIVGEILAGRASVRHYTSDPVTLDQLSTMLAIAHDGDKRDWPQEHVHGLPLTFNALVWRAEGVAPGVYRYTAKHHSLCWSTDVPSLRETTGLFLQDEFAVAPLAIWITGNLAGACARHGSFGHRQLLLRAGAAAHRLWMAALGMGLQGSLVSGLVPGAARCLLDFDGYHRTSLIAFIAGHGVPFR
jgi:SagB-type dehydrogenase family enzyme